MAISLKTSFCEGFIRDCDVQAIREEIVSAKRAIQTLGGKLCGAHSFELPFEGGSRTLVEIEKVSPTPDKYPRPNGKIKSKPL